MTKMTKRLTMAAVLSTFLLSPAPAQEQPIPDTGTTPQQDTGFSGIAGESALPVPQEAFVDTTYPCREARTLYNLLIEDASYRGPGEWLGFWISPPYTVTAGWYATLGRGLYVQLSDGDTKIASFFDGHTLDGIVDVISIGENPAGLSTDLWDTIFYRWALDEILDTLRDGENAAGDAALLDAARDWYAPLRR